MAYPISLPAGNPLITLIHPNSYTWLIELHNGQDSRLTVELVDHGLKPALDIVERHWRENRKNVGPKNPEEGKGSLIIVGRRDQDKFFSNGLDFPNVIKNPGFFPVTFDPLLERLIQFPIPTIAAINGHCFAGGMMLTLACDYRVMTDGTQRNAWMCMNEVHFGATWPVSFAAVLRAKVGDAGLRRKIALEGHRFTPKEALSAGLVDYIVKGNTAIVLEKAGEIAQAVSVSAQSGAWGMIKESLYRDALEGFGQDHRTRVEETAVQSKL
ncbi:ClpP/crotonase [Pluteus cervinus]|uniref:ClpP/crotonase n=1 Tax=Pluteus cervinus TaxID=181527 RepID=A0ACD3B5P9_9AGAR|nr:ClpP/crotonase [Pluteus cervinus]